MIPNSTNNGVPHVHLSGSDRRLLASTVESMLSKNESLVYMTTCFFRDILIHDYPPEVFVQESALSMSVLEAAQLYWNDHHIQDAAVQAIIKLSGLLRSRIVQLDSSDFYQTKSSNDRSSMLLYSYTASSHELSPPMYGAMTSTSDLFVNNLIHLLKSVSRSLVFHYKSFHLWKILDNLSFTLCRLVTTFPVNSKSVNMKIHEVLSDIAHCHEKSGDKSSSCSIVLCLSSLVHSVQTIDEEFVVSNDVKKCIQRLMNDSELLHYWPKVCEFFIKFGSPFVEARQLEFEKLDIDAVKSLLYAVQNATGHFAACHAVNNLANYVLPLQINSRLDENLMDYICQDGPWRDAFYRFLCVEPTCAEDEDLLAKIIELLDFIVYHMKDECYSVLEWVVPLCMEKGCAALRILHGYSLKSTEDSYGGTMLTPILRSLLDFYNTILLKADTCKTGNECLWDLFNSYVYILNDIGDKGCSSLALLQPILQGIASLTTKKTIISKLAANPKFCLVLVHRLTEVIISLQERSAGVSKDTFRSQGILFQASLSLLHLTYVMTADEKSFQSSHDWAGRCCAVIPCLWESRDLRVRSLGFQLCQIVTNSEKGVIMAMNVMDSPTFIWTCSYGALIDIEEACIVKQYAALVLQNLLKHYDTVAVSEYTMKPLILPDWSTLDDFTQLLSYVYWLPSMSTSLRPRDPNNSIGLLQSSFDSSSGGSSTSCTESWLITPKVLKAICRVLVEMTTSKLIQFHPKNFPAALTGSGLCPILFRLISTHSITPQLNSNWWIDCCSALSSVIETLICLSRLDRSISITLIGDQRSMLSLLQLFSMELPEGSEISQNIQKCREILTMLWVNSFILLTTLCRDSGRNFEDFVRSVWANKLIIFTRITDWCKASAMAKCRRVVLTFTQTLLKQLLRKHSDRKDIEIHELSDNPHSVLCQEWKERQTTFGSCLCNSLINVYEDSVNSEEKELALTALLSLVCLAPSAKRTAIQDNIIDILVERLRVFGLKHYDAVDTNIVGKKSVVNQWYPETMCTLSLLSALTFRNSDGKSRAMATGMVDALHKIFRWWKLTSDRTMLHSFLEILMNFTEEFPEGSHALILTTSTVGVGPKRAPTPQSFFIDILGILHQELESIEKSVNTKTTELIFELLKNSVFVSECRNIMIKSPVVSFITKLHITDIKKWGAPQHETKLQYLLFLISLTFHQDMQAGVAKIPEAIEILLTLLNTDVSTSLLALKVLRNLSFQASNKARFLCDDRVLRSLSAIIRDGQTLEEVETAAVGLWALIANSEKGKLLAKKSLCHSSVSKAIIRLQKMEQSSNDLLSQKQDVSTLLNVLNNLSNLLGVTIAPPRTTQ